MDLRFTSAAARDLRQAILDAGGVEVFAIGEVEGSGVVAVTIACRGLPDRVPALLDRPRAGQVVIHNHPSGDLRPSHADLELAGIYGEDGVGVVIVDSDVTRSNWVVEPLQAQPRHVDPQAIDHFFDTLLPAALPGAEARAEQRAMAHRVAAAMGHERPFVCEAGTGTGKSLAYLVPTALWARANDARVVISTFTRALQAQLLTSDLPVLGRAGLDVRVAMLQGRNNYLCRRRLALVDAEEAANAPGREALDALLEWSATQPEARRTDLPFHIDPALWERVESDSDLTLRVRCPHYDTCHYYAARRRAAGAHLVVVNHALLLADLAIRDAGGRGVLPTYHRLILDEAHHLERAATGAISRRLTLRAVQRAAAPLLSRRRRRGALERLGTAVDRLASRNAIDPAIAIDVGTRASVASELVGALRDTSKAVLTGIAADLLPDDRTPVRVTRHPQGSDRWQERFLPAAEELQEALGEVIATLGTVTEPLADVRLPEADAQPLLDLTRARRRLAALHEVITAFQHDDRNTCRWIEAVRSRYDPESAALVLAPIDVAGTLERILWRALPGTAATSATMTVAGRFEHWMRRSGLRDAERQVWASPFDHARQALLALPRDLPPPDDPAWLARSAEHVVEAVRLSSGGSFVLCTSYDAVSAYADALGPTMPAAWPLLVQRRTGKETLLERFKESPHAVLVGTDSFWEGVSVKGWGLRQVIIPRLPFRVPTDPLQEARHEQARQQGQDPFKAFTLPEAVLRLRQGYGRLIRSKTDRGVVLLLDRRVHDRMYGAVMLRSLPPARRVVGPWRRVRDELERFWRGEA